MKKLLKIIGYIIISPILLIGIMVDYDCRQIDKDWDNQMDLMLRKLKK